jgi:aerobic carbon-monoxide dehydrogenase medium subunit
MLAEFEYTATDSVATAVAALSATADGRPLAGGHGLLTAMKRGKESPSRLVDLRGIRELHGITEVPGALRIGALTTLTELLEHPAVRSGHPALVEAVRGTGDPQLRNRGTVGGSLATRHACADLSAPLLLADAAVIVVGPDGERRLSLVDFYGADGPLLDLSEIITAVYLPALPAGLGTAYEKMADRATLEPVCGVAAGVSRRADGTIDGVRLAVTGATFRPMRLVGVEHVPAERFVDDAVASAEYRIHLTRVLARRAIARAAERTNS